MQESESMSLDARGSAAQGGLGAVVIDRIELPPPPVSRNPIALSLGILGMFQCLFGSCMAANMKASDGLFYAFLAVPLLGPGLFVLYRRAALRCALTVYERGIIVARKGVDSAIPYSQVKDFSLSEQKKFTRIWSTTRSAHTATERWLEFTWEEQQLRMFQYSSVIKPDPFVPTVEQLLRRLADAAKARVDKGDTLRGNGWTLHSHGLEVSGQEAVPLHEVVNVELIDDRKLSFYRRGQPEPYFSAPVDSPNARLLERMVRG